MKYKPLYNPNQNDYQDILKDTEGRKFIVCSGSIYPHKKIPSTNIDTGFDKPKTEDYEKYCKRIESPSSFKEWLNLK